MKTEENDNQNQANDAVAAEVKTIDVSTAIGYLDDAALAAKKNEAKESNLHEVITVDEDEQLHATYFKKPKLEHLQVLADYAKKNEELKGLEILFNTCRVCGSDAVLTDEEMKVAAYKELAKLFKRREAIVKKR